MALILCKDCQKEFSTDAKKCPHCGANKPRPQTYWLGVVGGWFLLGLFLYGAFSQGGEKPPPAEPQPATDMSKEVPAAKEPVAKEVATEKLKLKKLTLKAGHPACLTADLLSQLNKAISDSDMNALNFLGENGCTITKAGVPVTELETGPWGFTVHVRAYAGKHVAEAWVYRDAINGLEPQ